MSLQSYGKDGCSHRKIQSANYTPTANDWLNDATQAEGSRRAKEDLLLVN